MVAMASQITNASIIYSTVFFQMQIKENIKALGSKLALCAENSPVTGEFPSQRSVTWKIFPFDDVITDEMISITDTLITICNKYWW